MGGADLGGQADVGAGDVVDVALDVFKNAKFAYTVNLEISAYN